MCAQFYLLPLGRFEEAIEEQAKAIAHDPLNSIWRDRRAFTFLCAGMYETAIAEARKALELDDGTYVPHLVIALSYFFQGKLAQAREPAEEALRIAPWEPLVAGSQAGLLVKPAKRTGWRSCSQHSAVLSE